MLQKTFTLPLLTLAEWWPALAIIPALLGIYTAVRVWKKDELVKAWKSLKELKADNSKLTRESMIRLDDLKDYLDQIDELQKTVSEQRTLINELSKRNSHSPDR